MELDHLVLVLIYEYRTSSRISCIFKVEDIIIILSTNGGAGEVHELRVGQGRGLHGGGHDGGAGGEVHELRVGANSFKVLAGQSLWPSRHVNQNFAISFLALHFEITPKKLRDQAQILWKEQSSIT